LLKNLNRTTDLKSILRDLSKRYSTVDAVFENYVDLLFANYLTDHLLQIPIIVVIFLARRSSSDQVITMNGAKLPAKTTCISAGMQQN